MQRSQLMSVTAPREIHDTDPQASESHSAPTRGPPLHRMPPPEARFPFRRSEPSSRVQRASRVIGRSRRLWCSAADITPRRLVAPHTRTPRAPGGPTDLRPARTRPRPNSSPPRHGPARYPNRFTPALRPARGYEVPAPITRPRGSMGWWLRLARQRGIAEVRAPRRACSRPRGCGQVAQDWNAPYLGYDYYVRDTTVEHALTQPAARTTGHPRSQFARAPFPIGEMGSRRQRREIGRRVCPMPSRAYAAHGHCHRRDGPDQADQREHPQGAGTTIIRFAPQVLTSLPVAVDRICPSVDRNLSVDRSFVSPNSHSG
jgi:hypothetical protein